MGGQARVNGKARQKMAQRAARVAEAVRLRRDFGMSAKQIALQLGVTQATAERYLSDAMGQWKKAVPVDVIVARANSEALLRGLLGKCLEEFEKSKQPTIKTVEEREVVEDEPQSQWPVTKVRRERIERFGDPRYLAEARALIQEHNKLFGLYKPVPQEVDLHGQINVAAVSALLTIAAESAKPENMLPVISEDGVEMARGPDGMLQLPEGGNGEQVEGNGDGE